MPTTPRSWHQEAALTVPDPAPRAADQLALIGPARPVRIPAELWRTWLADPNIVARFEGKRFRLSPNTCFPWLGAVSSTGHGSFRAASLPGRSRRGTVPAHLFAYQLAHGIVPRLGWSSEDDPVVCHRCDSHGCTNPDHLRLGTAAENRAEWVHRHRDPTGPLADLRGPAGRTRAIAQAVRDGLAAGDSTSQIEARIAAAQAAGLPLTLW
jgi:HNH endonuclease